MLLASAAVSAGLRYEGLSEMTGVYSLVPPAGRFRIENIVRSAMAIPFIKTI